MTKRRHYEEETCLRRSNLLVMKTQCVYILRMGGRAAEGNGLLNRHTGVTRIAGSNPAPSAIFLGEMAERFKAHPWKGCIRGTVSRVRISLSPP